MKINPKQAEALARFLLTIRPEWSRHYAIDAVSQMRFIDDDLERVTAAAVRGALNPKIAKPDVLAMNGEHWKPPKPTRSGPAVLIDGRCQACGHLHVANEPCPPPREQAQAATKHHATQARERIASARANLCPCGVRPRDCADHNPARQPEETP